MAMEKKSSIWGSLNSSSSSKEDKKREDKIKEIKFS